MHTSFFWVLHLDLRTSIAGKKALKKHAPSRKLIGPPSLMAHSLHTQIKASLRAKK
jgi:hypothetical protein